MGSFDLSLLLLITLGTLVLGLLVGRRESMAADGFLLGGRDLPWWLAGTSMVATTFAADTPLVVAGVTATQGLAGKLVLVGTAVPPISWSPSFWLLGGSGQAVPPMLRW